MVSSALRLSCRCLQKKERVQNTLLNKNYRGRNHARCNGTHCSLREEHFVNISNLTGVCSNKVEVIKGMKKHLSLSLVSFDLLPSNRSLDGNLSTSTPNPMPEDCLPGVGHKHGPSGPGPRPHCPSGSPGDY